MASLTMVALLLEASDALIKERPRSSTFRRRAVGTAYYAVFHSLAKLCADTLLQSADRDTEEYARIYRALEHGSLKAAFGKEPLRDRETLRRIGDIVVALQSERHRADYLPPVKNVFSIRDAEILVSQARQVVSESEGLGFQDRLTLATCLLFRGRQS